MKADKLYVCVQSLRTLYLVSVSEDGPLVCAYVCVCVQKEVYPLKASSVRLKLDLSLW